MPIQLMEENGGQTLQVHVEGTLVAADYERLVRENGKLHVLFDMSGFRGWTAGALW